VSEATFVTRVAPGVGEGVNVGIGVVVTGVGVTAVGVTGVGVTGVGVSAVGVTGVGVSAVGVTGVGVSTVGVTGVGVSGVAVPDVGVLVGTGVNVGGRCSSSIVGPVASINPCAGATGGCIQFSPSTTSGTTIIKILTAIAISSQIVQGAGPRPRPEGN
jgi:hypothetical protein